MCDLSLDVEVCVYMIVGNRVISGLFRSKEGKAGQVIRYIIRMHVGHWVTDTQAISGVFIIQLSFHLLNWA